jgi:hypothetical protein
MSYSPARSNTRSSRFAGSDEQQRAVARAQRSPCSSRSRAIARASICVELSKRSVSSTQPGCRLGRSRTSARCSGLRHSQ